MDCGHCLLSYSLVGCLLHSSSKEFIRSPLLRKRLMMLLEEHKLTKSELLIQETLLQVLCLILINNLVFYFDCELIINVITNNLIAKLFFKKTGYSIC